VTHEGNPDGLPNTADAACQLVGRAKDQLELLQLAEDQRSVASGKANASIDAAIKAVRQLFHDLDLVPELARSARFARHQAPNVGPAGAPSVLVFEEAYEQHRWDYEPTEEEERDWACTWPDPGSDWAKRFGESARAISESFPDADSATNALILIRDEDLTISQPTAVAMTRDRVDSAVVDNWNEEALKILKEGSDTVFYEIGDLVIIDAKQPRNQPYLDWAKQQPGINPAAKITMTKKGGAFDSGRIKAEGVSNRFNFEAAIKRVSKKKVEY
jgi:hypothetical protein